MRIKKSLALCKLSLEKTPPMPARPRGKFGEQQICITKHFKI